MDDDSNRCHSLNKAIVNLFFCLHNGNSQNIDQISNQLKELINDINKKKERLRQEHIEIQNIELEDTKLYHILQKKKPNYKFCYYEIKNITKRVCKSVNMELPRDAGRKKAVFCNWVNQNWEKLEQKFEGISFNDDDDDDEENED